MKEIMTYYPTLLLNVEATAEETTWWLYLAYAVLIFIIMTVLIFGLAKLDLFFTDNVKEGTAMAIMQGGMFHHWIMLHQDHTLNAEEEVVYEKGSRGSYPFHFFGRPWVGIPGFRKVLWYEMEWEEIDEATGQPYSRKERTRLIYVSDKPYALSGKDIEDSRNRPLNVVALITVRVTNLKRAMFGVGVGDYQQLFRGYATKQMVSLIGAHPFEELKSEMDKGVKFSTELLKLNKRVTGSKKVNGKNVTLRDLVGMEIIQASLHAIGFSGINELELQKASFAKVLAEEKAAAQEVTANGNAKQKRIEKGADNEMEKQRLDNWNLALQQNPLIGEIEKVELLASAIRETKANTLVLGEGTMLTVGAGSKGGNS